MFVMLGALAVILTLSAVALVLMERQPKPEAAQFSRA
jgi:hypothetical protein